MQDVLIKRSWLSNLDSQPWKRRRVTVDELEWQLRNLGLACYTAGGAEVGDITGSAGKQPAHFQAAPSSPAQAAALNGTADRPFVISVVSAATQEFSCGGAQRSTVCNAIVPFCKGGPRRPWVRSRRTIRPAQSRIAVDPTGTAFLLSDVRRGLPSDALRDSPLALESAATFCKAPFPDARDEDAGRTFIPDPRHAWPLT
mmetsp:Transcript_84910/g.183094  ORF Transcript_84910/g.183094 Transcript_84910/m.183094 type:complete len:200 (-) Transcript_84910:143-742(-)